MTVTAASASASRVVVSVVGAERLTGVSVLLRLPAGCAATGADGGDLLTRGGEVLALAGPKPDGTTLAAAALTRGGAPASGSGEALTIQTSGAGCGVAVTLLEATAYDANGAPTNVPLSGGTLPGSGSDSVLLFAVAGAIAAALVRRRPGTLRP